MSFTKCIGKVQPEKFLSYFTTWKIPVLLHNLKNYDSHLVTQELGKFNIKLTVIYQMDWKSTTWKIPVVLHNLKGYYSNLITQELGKFNIKLTAIYQMDWKSRTWKTPVVLHNLKNSCRNSQPKILWFAFYYARTRQIQS